MAEASIHHQQPGPSQESAHHAHEHTHEHGHDHHHEHELPHSRILKWLSVGGNVLIGSAQLALSAMTGKIDGGHNIADGGGYWLQYRNLQRGLTEAQRRISRKVTYWALSASSAVFATKAGSDALLGHESSPHHTHVYAAAGSLALNGVLAASLWHSERRRRAEYGGRAGRDIRDIYKHFLVSDAPSSVMAFGGAMMVEHGLERAEQAAAVAIGGLTAWMFRPTRKNLGDQSKSGWWQAWRQSRKDARQAEVERPWWQWVESATRSNEPMREWAASQRESDGYKQWKQKQRQAERRTSVRRRWRTALAAGAAAVALGAGLASDTASKVVEAEPSVPESPVATQPVQPPAPAEDVPPPTQVPLTETIQTAPGDSQWSLAEQRIESVTGQPAQAPITKIAAALAAAENAHTNPNPHHINAGQNLAVLSDEAIAAVHASYSNSASSLQPKLEDLIRAEWDEVIDLVDESGINLQIQKVATSS